AEERDGVTDRIAAQTLAPQPRVGEGDAERRAVGTKQGPRRRCCIFDFEQRSEAVPLLSFQCIRPAIRAALLLQRSGAMPTCTNIGDVTDLVEGLVLHDFLQLYRQTDCHMDEVYAFRKQGEACNACGTRRAWQRVQ